MPAWLADRPGIPIDQWVFVEQLAALDGLPSHRSVRRSLQPVIDSFNGTQHRYAKRVASKGGPKWQYNLALFSDSVRERLLKCVETGAAPPHSPGDQTAAVSPNHQGGDSRSGFGSALVPSPKKKDPLTLFDDFQLPDRLRTEAGTLTREQAAEAEQTYWKIVPCFGDRCWKTHQGKVLGGTFIRVKHDYVKVKAAECGWSAGKIYRLMRRFKRRPTLRSLLRQPRADRGASKTLDEQDKFNVAKLYLNGCAPPQIRKEMERQFDKRIGLDAIAAFVRSIPEPIKVRALHGRKALNDGQLPYIERDWAGDYQSNDIWICDHAQFDFFVNAWDGLKPVRPWLTAFMDGYSGVIAGICITLQPDSKTIASALRDGIMRYGLPKAVYLDNGKDMRAQYLAGGQKRIRKSNRFESLVPLPNAETDGLLTMLDIDATYALPYHPQSKPIERFFGTMHKLFDRVFNSYCGPDPKHRPDSCQIVCDAHTRAVDTGHPADSPLPTIADAVVQFRDWLETEYHAEPRTRGRGRRKFIPMRAYAPSPRTIEARDLDVLLMERKSVKVTRAGVRLLNRRYDSETGEFEELAFHNGHQAEAAYDTMARVFPDQESVVLNCCGETFLLTASTEPDTPEATGAMIARRRSFSKRVDQAIGSIHDGATVATPGQRRELAAAAKLPPELDPRTEARVAAAQEPDGPVRLRSKGNTVVTSLAESEDEDEVEL